MSDGQAIKPPVWFWMIAILAVLWNLLGVFSYLSFVTMSADELAALPEAEQALVANTPAWAIGAFAIAVFAGVTGAVLLLLRSRWAPPVFIASLIGALVQMSRLLLMTDFIEIYGPGRAVTPIVVIIVALFLVWFSMRAKGRGWLK